MAAAAVSAAVEEVGLEDAGAVLAALSEVRSAPVTAVARALYASALPEVPPAISAKRQAQLEAACRRLDRYSAEGPGAWVLVACQVLAGWAAGEPGRWLSDPPRSLGALALELRREANARRFGALRRASEYLRPLAAMSERAEAKARCDADARLQRRRTLELVRRPRRG